MFSFGFGWPFAERVSTRWQRQTSALPDLRNTRARLTPGLANRDLAPQALYLPDLRPTITGVLVKAWRPDPLLSAFAWS